jgi:hypothetical protein
LEKTGKTGEARALCSELKERRAAALEAYRTGDYARAERLLRSLIPTRYELPNAQCLLGCILLMQDRLREAVKETAAAWKYRAEGPFYVVPRTLWLHLALLYTPPPEEDKMDTVLRGSVIAAFEDAGMDTVPEILGRLKTALARRGKHVEWTMDPVLAYLQPRLPAKRYQLMAAVVAALSDATKLPILERFSFWRNSPAKPLAKR